MSLDRLVSSATKATIGSMLFAAGFFSNSYIFPPDPIIQEKKVEVIKKIPYPSETKYKPLENPKDVCKGAPGVIEKMTVASSVEEPKKNFTWLTLRPAGDEYTVQCFMSGDYSFSWEEGDLISLPQGGVASER